MTPGPFPIQSSPLPTGIKVLAGLAGALMVDAFLVEPRLLEVNRHTIWMKDLPKSHQDFRVAHLTDVHLRRPSGLHQRVAKAIDGFDPQLVVLTGDIIDHKSEPDGLDTFCDWITWPGRKVVAVPGNWEYRSPIDVDELRRIYGRHGIELLIDQWLEVETGVIVAGTDDGASNRSNLAALVEDLPEGEIRILLSHAPGLLDEYPAGSPPFDLSLCGHTHGGQITLAGFAPRRPEGSGSYVAGFYDTPAGRTYVSRGIGTITIPARLFCRPEVALFRFK